MRSLRSSFYLLKVSFWKNKKKYLKFVRVLLLYKFCRVNHDLIVDTGKSIDNLVEHLNTRVLAFGLFRNDFENIPVEIKCIFELGNLIFELEVFFFEKGELLLHDLVWL
jgi:hypothetical protein